MAIEHEPVESRVTPLARRHGHRLVASGGLPQGGYETKPGASSVRRTQ